MTKRSPILANGIDFGKQRLDLLNVMESIVDLIEHEFHLYGTVEKSMYQICLH